MLHQNQWAQAHAAKICQFSTFSKCVTFLSGANFVRRSNETGRLPRQRCYSKNDLFIDSHSVSWYFAERENGISSAACLLRGNQ